MILESATSRFRIPLPFVPGLVLEAVMTGDTCAWFWSWDGCVIRPVDPGVA